MTWNNDNTNNNWNSAPSPWEGFEQVEARKSRNDFLPPDLDTVATIEELKVVQSQKNMGQQVFIAVLKTENEEGIVKHYDWVAKMTERVYLQNIKALVLALNPEADPNSFGREVMEHLTGPDQPCKWLNVRLRTEQIVTKKGNEFTKVSWYSA